MKILLLFLFCFQLIPVLLFSQRSISGYVVDAAVEHKPIAGSSVFLSNTSIGTIADKNGYFELNNLPAGRYDLVISSVGYETNVYSFNAEQLPLRLRVEMLQKVKELDNVTVEPWVEEGWDKWGAMFMGDFIGRTPNAGRCRIKNEKAIRFRYYKKSNRVVAFSDEPLIIENKALGYLIRYQLENFEVNFNERSSSFAGYPLFEEIDKGGRGKRHRWDEARKKAYYGSMMHFMRSLYKDSLLENGYEVRRMVKIPNLEKQRVKNIYRSTTGIIINAGERPSPVYDDSTQLPQDSIDYYQRVLRQKDYNEIYGKELMRADSLILQTDGAYKILYFKDYLYITYRNESEDKEYLMYFHENRSPTFQRSYIWLVHGEPVTIDIVGNYYPPQEIFSTAYWAWSEKIADLLPQGYQP